MLKRRKRIIIRLAVFVSVIIVIAVVIWRIAIFAPAPEVQTSYQQHSQLPSKSIAENVDKSSRTDIVPAKPLQDKASYEFCLTSPFIHQPLTDFA